jgi:uncharacterized protein
MAIVGFDRSKFERVIQTTLSPTTPIRSPEHLRGRERKLEDIRRALVQPGRNIFVFGDRGVGKTSLAQTAAFEHQSASNKPIFVGCDASSTFYSVAQEIAARLLDHEFNLTKTSKQTKGGFSSKPLTVEHQRATELGPVQRPTSVNEALHMLAQSAGKHSTQPVIVIDEFERVIAAEDRALFADLIKQAGDQSAPFKIIFCGVASSLEQLLDAHHSCYRYLVSVQLERLLPGPRFQIINAASEAVGVTIEHSSLSRISAISDGFPHYVHLITEKLLWEIFSDESPINISTPQHYLQAVRSAVEDIEPKLKATYEKATLKYSVNEEYEGILFAIADHHELKRRSADIFDLYCSLMRAHDRQPISRGKFTQRINALKKDNHACILTGSRQGWYEFTEPVMRGYVRLRAEDQGIQLGADHAAEYRGHNRLRIAQE